MNYSDTIPSKHLAHLVRCFWSLEQPKTGVHAPPEPVLPDGCVELIFNLADPFVRHHTDGAIETQPRAIVAGQMCGPALIGPSGEVDLFGIRFHHAGAYPFFRLPLSELTNNIVDLNLVWGAEAEYLHERLHTARTFAGRVAVAESALYRMLMASTKLDPLFDAAAGIIARQPGDLSIEQLAAELNIGGRRLERRFQTRLGISPKFFSRILRFQNVLQSVRADREDILGAALAAGYYDQSHLIREFKEFSGTTPAEFFGREHALSEVFIAA